MASGIEREFPHATIVCCPIGDGGEGTLEALAASNELDLKDCAAMRLDGKSASAQIGYFNDGESAFIESAHCIGLHLVETANRDIMAATSFGVGELILQAAHSGARHIFVGVGGSASNDGGCGMAQALGIRFLDAEHQVISDPIGGGVLDKIAAIDASDLSPLLVNVSVTVLCDVTNPVIGNTGAANIFAAQKGATPDQIVALESGMQSMVAVINRDLSLDVKNVPGTGAAGGLAAGLMVFTSAAKESGIEFVLEQTGFSRRVVDCDLCLVGEGRIDGQSLSGKACLGVANVAMNAGVPVVALVGSSGPGAEQCLDAGIERIVVIGKGLSQNESIARCADLLATAAVSEVRRLV